MTPLRVLLPLALLVAVTLAEFPSSNEIRFFGKESSREEDILHPPNPAIENEDNNGEPEIPKNPETPAKPETPKKPETPVKPVEPKAVDYRLPEDIEPTHYTLELEVNQKQLPNKDYKYDGKVQINLVVKKATKVIKFHLNRRSILELANIELKEDESGKVIAVKQQEENNLDVSICELTADAALDVTKKYTLSMTYKGVVNETSSGFYKGSYLNEKGEKRWYAATHFEPLGARSAFPCFDEPALKAEFSITIIHSTGYEAISNMPIEKSEVVDTDRKKVVFKKTPKMSTYLVAFAITDFGKTGEQKATVYARKDVVEMGEYAKKIGDQVLKELEDYTGIKYALPKIDQIALPLLRPGAMENWGLVTYKETSLLYNADVNATIAQQKVASIIAHEFAHQWFGNLVSPKWWKYVWLNEGFATYFQYYIADKINPSWRFMDQFNVDALQNTAFTYDANLKKTRPMDYEETSEKEIGDFFDSIAYQKAGSVIRMFAHVLGDEKFQKGLQEYLTANQEKAVTSAALYEALDKVVDKKVLPDDANVATVFGNWATQKGYPVIKVTKDKKGTTVTVTQEPFYLEKPAEGVASSWYIPLNYVEQSEEPNFNVTSVKLWLKPGDSSVELPEKIEKDNWIIFNIQQTGYYRVNYDDDNWNAIALYLNGENFTKIHPLNRAQLIDDALNLASVGKLEYDIALNLIEYLHQETDYIVWKSAFNGLSTLKKLLATTEYYDAFLKYLLTITESLLETVSLNIKDDDEYLTKLLRVDALKWACDSGSQKCKTYATQEVEKWLLDPYNNVTLNRDLNKALLCGALRNATFVEWQRVLVKYATSTDPEEKAIILSTLGCSLSEETLKYLLELAVQPDSIFTGRLLEVFQTVYSNSGVGVTVALDFISENIDKLKTYDPLFYEHLEKYIKELANLVVVSADVTKLQDIVALNLIPLEKVKDAMDITVRNEKWFKENGKKINSWFTDYSTVTKSPVSDTTEQGDSAAGSLSFSTLLLAAPLVLARLR